MSVFRAKGILFCLLLLCFSVVHAALLRVGNPLSFAKSKPHLAQVRMSGVNQFVNHYHRTQRVETPRFLWGDEVEYGVFTRTDGDDAAADGKISAAGGGSAVDYRAQPKNGKYDLSLRGAEIREYLSALEEKSAKDLANACSAQGKTCDTSGVAKKGELQCLWTPEYGAWMVEAVPAAPYDGYAEDLLLCEQSMNLRRQRLHMALNENEIAPSLSSFPMLGHEGYGHNPAEGKAHGGNITTSHYVDDSIINPHPRFGALTQNIRTRRGSRVCLIAERDVPLVAESKDGSSSNSEFQTESTMYHIDTIADGKKPLNPSKRPNTSTTDSTKPPYDREREIHMDAMAFGMGSCCLQVTMQSRNERESRFLHDQLAPLAPYFLALTASTPLAKGSLIKTDTRWDYIGMAVDCRTDAERSVQGADKTSDKCLAGGGVTPIANSRYSGISRYIAHARNAEEEAAIERMNDLPAVLDPEVLNILKGRDIDTMLAKHLAHMFARDPLVIFDDAIELENDKVLDHFDNLQSTNWRTMRWKPPTLDIGFEAQKRQAMIDKMRSSALSASAGGPGDSSLTPEENEWFQKDLGDFGAGWRIEFRPMELSLTDFENAAFSTTIVLITRAILALGYNFYMPLSAVEVNMQRSKQKDAVVKQKFFVRKNALTQSEAFQIDASGNGVGTLVPDDMELLELTIDEIFNGQAASTDGNKREDCEPFPGFIPAILLYLQEINCEESVVEHIKGYLDLLSKRASGELPTTARWIRNFVESHPLYDGKGDINEKINDDLCQLCDDIGMGLIQRPDLYGNHKMRSLACVTAEMAAPFLEKNSAKIGQLKEVCQAQAHANTATVAVPAVASSKTIPVSTESVETSISMNFSMSSSLSSGSATELYQMRERSPSNPPPAPDMFDVMVSGTPPNTHVFDLMMSGISSRCGVVAKKTGAYLKARI